MPAKHLGLVTSRVTRVTRGSSASKKSVETDTAEKSSTRSSRSRAPPATSATEGFDYAPGSVKRARSGKNGGGKQGKGQPPVKKKRTSSLGTDDKGKSSKSEKARSSSLGTDDKGKSSKSEKARSSSLGTGDKGKSSKSKKGRSSSLEDAESREASIKKWKKSITDDPDTVKILEKCFGPKATKSKGVPVKLPDSVKRDEKPVADKRSHRELVKEKDKETVAVKAKRETVKSKVGTGSKKGPGRPRGQAQSEEPLFPDDDESDIELSPESAYKAVKAVDRSIDIEGAGEEATPDKKRKRRKSKSKKAKKSKKDDKDCFELKAAGDDKEAKKAAKKKGKHSKKTEVLSVDMEKLTKAQGKMTETHRLSENEPRPDSKELTVAGILPNKGPIGTGAASESESSGSAKLHIDTDVAPSDKGEEEMFDDEEQSESDTGDSPVPGTSRVASERYRSRSSTPAGSRSSSRSRSGSRCRSRSSTPAGGRSRSRSRSRSGSRSATPSVTGERSRSRSASKSPSRSTTPTGSGSRSSRSSSGSGSDSDSGSTEDEQDAKPVKRTSPRKRVETPSPHRRGDSPCSSVPSTPGKMRPGDTPTKDEEKRTPPPAASTSNSAALDKFRVSLHETFEKKFGSCKGRAVPEKKKTSPEPKKHSAEVEKHSPEVAKRVSGDKSRLTLKSRRKEDGHKEGETKAKSTPKTKQPEDTKGKRPAKKGKKGELGAESKDFEFDNMFGDDDGDGDTRKGSKTVPIMRREDVIKLLEEIPRNFKEFGSRGSKTGFEKRLEMANLAGTRYEHEEETRHYHKDVCIYYRSRQPGDVLFKISPLAAYKLNEEQLWNTASGTLIEADYKPLLDKWAYEGRQMRELARQWSNWKEGRPTTLKQAKVKIEADKVLYAAMCRRKDEWKIRCKNTENERDKALVAVSRLQMKLDGYEKGGADAWKTFAKGDIKFKIETAEGEAKDAKRKLDESRDKFRDKIIAAKAEKQVLVDVIRQLKNNYEGGMAIMAGVDELTMVKPKPKGDK